MKKYSDDGDGIKYSEPQRQHGEKTVSATACSDVDDDSLVTLSGVLKTEDV